MQQDVIVRTIAARVRAARMAASMSRKRLAEIAGVSERYLSDLEKGEANASIGILCRVAEALGKELAALLPASAKSAGPRKGAGSIDDALLRLINEMSPGEQKGAVATLRRYLDQRRQACRGIALLGLRGAGKSTIGRMLSERHALPFLSVTREVEVRAGMSINDLFNLGGAEAYRALENEVIADFVGRRDLVVLETAGGIAANAKALDQVLGTFHTIWLRADPETHLSRVAGQGDTRPTRGNPKALEHLKALLAGREAGFSRAESVVDTTDKSVEQCVGEIEALAAALLRGAGAA